MWRASRLEPWRVSGRRFPLRRAALLSVVLLTGCAGGAADRLAVTDQSVSSACIEAPVRAGSPHSIVGIVEHLNAMPKPVSLPCFVESLTRPMGIHASKSMFSIQATLDERSPRIFLFSDPVIMSVVPVGIGSDVLEIGELRSETRSVKAEIAFPVEAELPLQEPFERIQADENVTNCAFCHADEQEDASIEFARAFVSGALRPEPALRVSAVSVRQEFIECDAAQEAERCALLDAIFGWGDLFEREFPAAMATFP